MFRRKRLMLLPLLIALLAALALTPDATAGPMSKSDGSGKFYSVQDESRDHFVDFSYSFEGPAMPSFPGPEFGGPGFGGVSSGVGVVKDFNHVVFGVGAGYVVEFTITCGQRSSDDGLAFWGMATKKEGTLAGQPDTQFFAVAKDVSQVASGDVATGDENDRFLWILSDLTGPAPCPQMPDFNSFFPGEGGAPAGCDWENGQLNQFCRQFDPDVDAGNPIMNEDCAHTADEFDENGNPNPGDLYFPATGHTEFLTGGCGAGSNAHVVTAVWTGGDDGGQPEGGLATIPNDGKVNHQFDLP